MELGRGYNQFKEDCKEQKQLQMTNIEMNV